MVGVRRASGRSRENRVRALPPSFRSARRSGARLSPAGPCRTSSPSLLQRRFRHCLDDLHYFFRDAFVERNPLRTDLLHPRRQDDRHDHPPVTAINSGSKNWPFGLVSSWIASSTHFL